MLCIFLLAYPQLMERPQARKNTATDPTCKLPLRSIPWRKDTYSRAWEHTVKLNVESASESVNERAGTHHHDIVEQDWSEIYIACFEGGVDEAKYCLAGLRSGILRVLCHVRVEHSFTIERKPHTV